MEPAVAAGLANLGWRSEDPEVREGVPPVLRGGNVVAVLPDGPAWASPLIAALLGAQPPAAGRVLILASPATLGEWTLAVGALVESTSLQIDTAWDGEGASVRTATRRADLLIASPESALARHARSALHPETFCAIVFAWPEQWAAEEAITALLQDVPKTTQRVVLTTRRDDLDGADSLVERYARKASIVAPAIVAAPPATPTTMSVRTVATSWAGRAANTAGIVAALDAADLTIWTADRRDHQLIHRTLGSLRPGLRLRCRDLPEAGTVICYDLPSPQQLAAISAVGEVLLLVPPGAEGYVARLAATRRPMSLRSPEEATRERDAALRGHVAGVIDRGDPSAALYALAPLFERYDAQSVAAALFTLWQTRPAAAVDGAGASRAVPSSAPEGAVRARTGVEPVAKLWIGAGKNDDATVADFVAVLVREVGVERARIGRIELRDTFALVEVPAADAESIALRLSGITIRKRKLTARVDQGRAGSARPRAKPRS